jgi:SHS2 domain-containing protein
MEQFTVLDISGDVGLTAFGDNLQEAFVNIAIGMYTLMTGLDAVAATKMIEVSVENQSPDGLLVSWLNELIFQFDTYGFIGKKIDITEFSETRISAKIAGEEFDPERHEGKLLIKAATYHQLSIAKEDERWKISVIFDI